MLHLGDNSYVINYRMSNCASTLTRSGPFSFQGYPDEF